MLPSFPATVDRVQKAIDKNYAFVRAIISSAVDMFEDSKVSQFVSGFSEGVRSCMEVEYETLCMEVGYETLCMEVGYETLCMEVGYETLCMEVGYEQIASASSAGRVCL